MPFHDFDSGWFVPQNESLLFGCFYNGFAQMVLGCYFNFRSQPEQFILSNPKSFYTGHRWFAFGQSTRFVEYKGIDFSEVFHFVSPFDQNSVFGPIADSGNNGDWYRDYQCARTGDDQKGQGQVNILGDKPNQH